MIELSKIELTLCETWCKIYKIMWIEVEFWESTNPRGTKFKSSLDRQLNYSEEPTPKADAQLSKAVLK